MTPEQEKEALLSTIESKVTETMQKRGYQTKDEVTAAVKAEMKTFETLDIDGIRAISEMEGEGDNKENKFVKALRAQGTKIVELENKMKTSVPKDTSLRAQAKEWLDTNKAALDAFRANPSAAPQLTPLVIRAAETMTIANSLNGSAYLPNPVVLPGVVDLVRLQPTFWDRLRKGTIKANPLVWVNKSDKQGAAAFIGEGILKPLASFDLTTETSVPKKVAERMKISTELLYDLDYIESIMIAEIRYEVEMAANTAVLVGTASSTSPAGITTIASAFNLTTISTTNPTTADAVRAAIAQIRSLNFTGLLTAYMNPIDVAEMDMEKASDSGVYMLPPFANAENTIIKGVTIVEDNNIPVGNLLIGDMNLYKIAMHQPFHIMWGWENDDFSKNLVTVIGEMRFHQYFSANHVGAWIYEEIDTIKAAISTQI